MLIDAGGRGRNSTKESSPQRGAPAYDGVEPWSGDVAPLRRRRLRWQGRYRLVVLCGDALVASMASAVMLAVRPGAAVVTSPYAWMCWALPFLWPMALAFVGAYQPTLFGNGSEEFRKVARAGLLLLAGVSIVSYGAMLEIARSLVFIAFPAVIIATLVERLAARRWLRRARNAGRCMKRVVAVGRDGAVTDLVLRLQQDRYAGMEVVAACVADPADARMISTTEVPVDGGLDAVVDVVRRRSADAVAVTSASETAAVYLRQLSWQLEGSGIELLVSPGLIEVAGPRLHIKPFVGLPLLSIEEPHFAGWKRVLKEGLDRVGAALAILLLTPVLLVIAVGVRMAGPGPVLYRQVRVGAGGRHYTMFKFRSMAEGAETRLVELQALNECDGPLFKIRDDPRVTRLGWWLRRYSLDELPQLFNVVAGSMSLVGPRPPLPEEADRYDSSARRRLLVKPGLTGLWQISGRSDLTWEESVRLDLRYVENWSLTLDALILWKTLSAVLRSRGAY